MDILEETNWF